MTDLRKQLSALSATATQGEWQVTAAPDLSVYIQPSGSADILFHGGGQPAGEGNDAVFIATLVNAYRSGKLAVVGELNNE